MDNLQRVLIGHDGKGHGAGIFIEKVKSVLITLCFKKTYDVFFVHRKVVVRAQSGDFSANDFIFACSRWLDDHEEDGKIERELQLSGWLQNISSCDTHVHTVIT